MSFDGPLGAKIGQSVLFLPRFLKPFLNLTILFGADSIRPLRVLLS